MYYIYADGKPIFNPLDPELGIVAPKVSLELGKAGSFQFDIPPTNKFYDSLKQLKTIITVNIDDYEVFRGRIFSIQRKFNKMKSVQCEGVLAYLVDSVQKAVKYNGDAYTLFKKIISNHNEMMGSDTEKTFRVSEPEEMVPATRELLLNTTVIVPGKKEDDDKYYGSDKYAQAVIESIVDEWLTSFDYINDVLIDYIGGYLIAFRENNRNRIRYISIDELDKKITDAEENKATYKTIDFGTNMLDLTEEVNAEELFTVLIPLGDDNLTVKNVADYSSTDGVTHKKGSVEIVDTKAVEKYGRIVRTYAFENVNSASTLFSDGRKYLKAHKHIPTTFTVKALDMHFIDESNKIISIGEVVRVRSNPHGIVKMLMCTKIEYDLEKPDNNAYTFGNPKQSMTERYKKNKDKQTKDSKSRASKGGGGAAQAAAEDGLYNFYTLEEIFNPTKAWVDDNSVNLETVLDYYSAHGAGTIHAKDWIDTYGAHAEKAIEYYTKYSAGLVETKQWVDGRSAGIDQAIAFYTKDSSGLISTKQWVDAYQAASMRLMEFYTKQSGALISTKEWVNAYYAASERVMKFYTDQSSALISAKQWVNSHYAATEDVIKYYNQYGGGLIDTKKFVDGYKTYVSNIATHVGTDGKLRSYTEISQEASETKAVISLLTKYVYDPKTKKASRAGLKIYSDTKGSYIDLNATYIQSEAAAYFKSIESDYVKTKTLEADNFQVLMGKADKSIKIGNYTLIGGSSVSTQVINCSNTAYVGSLCIGNSNDSTSLKDYIEGIVKNTVNTDYVRTAFQGTYTNMATCLATLIKGNYDTVGKWIVAHLSGKEVAVKSLSVTYDGKQHDVYSWDEVKANSSHTHSLTMNLGTLSLSHTHPYKDKDGHTVNTGTGLRNGMHLPINAITVKSSKI